MSVLTDAMNAVTAALNAESFSLNFVAEARYRPHVDAMDLQAIKAAVVPGRITLARHGRTTLSRDIEIHVVIQSRIIGDDDITDYLTLAEQIESFCAGRMFEGRFVCLNTERERPFAVEHVDQMAVFTTVITLTINDAVLCSD